MSAAMQRQRRRQRQLVVATSEPPRPRTSVSGAMGASSHHAAKGTLRLLVSSRAARSLARWGFRMDVSGGVLMASSRIAATGDGGGGVLRGVRSRLCGLGRMEYTYTGKTMGGGICDEMLYAIRYRDTV
jgi:hypothetical protein